MNLKLEKNIVIQKSLGKVRKWNKRLLTEPCILSIAFILNLMNEAQLLIGIYPFWPWFYIVVLEMVLCYQNCSDLLLKKSSGVQEKLWKFGAEGWQFAFLGLLEQFIQTVKG